MTEETGDPGVPAQETVDEAAVSRQSWLDSPEYQQWRAANAGEIQQRVAEQDAERRQAAREGALHMYGYGTDRLLEVLGRNDRLVVKAAHAQAQVALARRITELATSADADGLAKLVDAYITLPEPNEDFPDCSDA